MVLFYSAEIELKRCTEYLQDGVLDGSFFVHGLFFAHEIENPGLYTGTTDSVYINPDHPNKEKWERNPGDIGQ